MTTNTQTVVTLLAIVALIFGAIGFAGWFYGYKAEKGDTGDIGPTGPIGQVGPQGPQGEVGPSPDFEWNGTCIRFITPEGEWSDWVDLIGPAGPTGATGTAGEDGNDGADGIDGVDYQNDAPVILVNDSDSYVVGCGFHDDYRFCLNISFDDTENDYKKVALYYKWAPEDEWVLEDSWVYQTNGDYIVDWESLSTGYGPEILHWLVEVQDGYNLEYLEGSTTLYKPDCP